MWILYGAICLCALGKFGAKAELKLYFEDTELREVDDEYIDEETFESDINIDNTISLSVLVKKRFPRDTQARFTVLGLSNGKYTTPTGLDILDDLCEAIDEPIIVGPLLTAIGLRSDDCPPSPGLYSIEHWSPFMGTLPDDFPDNKYMVIFRIGYEDHLILDYEIYVDAQS